MLGWSSDLCVGVPKAKAVNQLYPSSVCWIVVANHPLFITPKRSSSPSVLTPRDKVCQFFSDPLFGTSQLDSISQGLRKAVPLLPQGWGKIGRGKKREFVFRWQLNLETSRPYFCCSNSVKRVKRENVILLGDWFNENQSWQHPQLIRWVTEKRGSCFVCK